MQAETGIVTEYLFQVLDDPASCGSGMPGRIQWKRAAPKQSHVTESRSLLKRLP